MANRFSKLEIGVSNWRRVGHSTTNYFSSIDRSSFGFKNAATQIIDKSAQAGGLVGGVGGGIAIAMSTAAAGGLLGAGFLAAVAGPQVAVTAAVIGLALFIKGAYSNREAAHKAINPHVWSLIDSDTPTGFTAETLKAASDAASELLDDGKNQIKLLGSKLGTAQKKFHVVNVTMIGYHNELVELRKGRDQAKRNAPLFVATANGQIIALKAKAKALWDKEAKTGGAIFEYVRRCSHTANYVQAPMILSLAMQQNFDDAVLTKPVVDFFLGSADVAAMRKSFTDLDAAYSVLAGDE